MKPYWRWLHGPRTERSWYFALVIAGALIAVCAQAARAEEPPAPRPLLVALETSADLSPAVSAAMDAAAFEAAARTTTHAMPAAAQPAAEHATADPFVRGARYWSVTTGASRDASLGTVSLAQFNINHYIAHRLALVYGGMVGYVNTNRAPAAVLGGPDLGMRWQWLTAGRWSTYLEGLVSAVWQTQPLTEESLRFNFDLEPGSGATYRLNERTLVQGGFRWHHLSNARVRGQAHNFGYDGPMLYVELLKAF